MKTIPTMMTPILKAVCATLLFACCTVPAFADRIVPYEGRTVNGKIILMTKERVSFEVGDRKVDVDANKIESISFDGEPGQMNSARASIKGSRVSEAFDTLSKIDAAKLPNNPYLKQDYEYLLAYCVGYLALTEGGDLAEAEKRLDQFLKANERHYHYYDAYQLYGDILVARSKPDEAEKAYAVLAKAPWPEYNLKAKVALGNAQVGDKNVAAARKNFQEVLDSKETTASAEAQKQLAQVGMARCLVAENKAAEGVKLLEEAAGKANPENVSLQAAIFAALGDAYEKSDKTGFAIVAYTSVDVLYPGARVDHIASLRALSDLWRKQGRIDRAEDVEKKLKDVYNLTVK